jgi:hypothetical protein
LRAKDFNFLLDSDAISDKLPIPHAGLFPLWMNIHAADKKSILGICGMSLRVVNEK